MRSPVDVLAHEADDRERLRIAHRADRAPRVERHREAGLGLPYVAEAGEDLLVEQGIADRASGIAATQASEEGCGVEVRPEHIRTEAREAPVGAQPLLADELEHGPVELDDLPLPHADHEPRFVRSTRPTPAALVHAPGAGHAQVRVQRELALEVDQQVLAASLGAAHRAPGQPLGPVIERVARLGRQDLLGYAAREHGVDPAGGVVDCVALGHLLQGCPTVAIPQTALIVSGPFGTALSAEDVARAIARGLHAAGLPEPDICPIEAGQVAASEIAALLAGLDFDARMRSARAVVLAEKHLRESTLRGSIAFEIATRARQGGVPAYAVTAENALAPFDARILDLQLILEASTPRSLAAAGRKLAQVL